VWFAKVSTMIGKSEEAGMVCMRPVRQSRESRLVVVMAAPGPKVTSTPLMSRSIVVSMIPGLEVCADEIAVRVELSESVILVVDVFRLVEVVDLRRTQDMLCERTIKGLEKMVEKLYR
jgi:hypothetical protein